MNRADRRDAQVKEIADHVARLRLQYQLSMPPEELSDWLRRWTIKRLEVSLHDSKEEVA